MASEALPQWSAPLCPEEVCCTPTSDPPSHTSPRSLSPPFTSSSPSSPSETPSPRNSFLFPSPSPCRPLTPRLHSVTVTQDANATLHASYEREGDATSRRTPSARLVETTDPISPPPLSLPPRQEGRLSQSQKPSFTTPFPLLSLRQRRRRARQRRMALQQWPFHHGSRTQSISSFPAPLSFSSSREVSASASPFPLDVQVLEEEQNRMMDDLMEEMALEKRKRFLNWWRAWHQREGTMERSVGTSCSQPPPRLSNHGMTAVPMAPPRNKRCKKKGKSNRKQRVSTALCAGPCCAMSGCRHRFSTTLSHASQAYDPEKVVHPSTTTTPTGATSSSLSSPFAFFWQVVLPPLSLCLRCLAWVWSLFHRYIWLPLFPMEEEEDDRGVNERLEEDESPPLELTMLAFSVGERIWGRFSSMTGGWGNIV